MATIKDVAKLAGINVGTVSRVLNNRGYISNETREKVYHAMNTLNYNPNEIARSLSKKHTNTIAIIVPHVTHPYFAKLISHVETAARLKHYKLLLFNSKDDPELEFLHIEICKNNRVSGIILCSASVNTQYFASTHVPLVTIERHLGSGMASVECDNFNGGELAARHLIECGCKNLLHISGIVDMDMPADSREQGFVMECERSAVSHIELKSSLTAYNTLDYRELIHNALLENPQIDGIFASSDIIAAQIIQVCQKLNIKLPSQMKIVGFDDVSLSELTYPTITTICQPLDEMAKLSVSFIAKLSAGEIVPSRTVLPVTLIKRQSTNF